jgi:hypothetical protein
MTKEGADIHCPKCEWRPGPQDRWVCTPSCGTVWNTFWTRGVCPGCGVKWPITQCLECGQYSRHEDWYHEPPEADADAPRVDEALPEKA